MSEELLFIRPTLPSSINKKSALREVRNRFLARFTFFATKYTPPSLARLLSRGTCVD